MTAYEPTELTAETKRANARLRAALARTGRDFAFAKSLVRAAQPPVPDVGPGVSVDVRHTPGHPTGTDWWAVARVGSEVRVVLADTAGPATPAGATVPLFTRTVAARFADLTPGNLLAAVNRELIALGFDDPLVVAMTAVRLDAESGRYAVARAGSPRPTVVSADGTTYDIVTSGPLLGVFDAADYPEHAGELRAGESVVLTTDGDKDSADDSTRMEIGFW